MDDHRQREAGFVGITRDQVDTAQVFVVMMAFGSSRNPVQDKIGCRNQHDISRVGIEGVLSWTKRSFPDTSFPFCNLLAVTKGIAGKVATGGAVITDDDTDMTNRNHGFRSGFHRRKPAIDKVCSVRNRLVLASSPSSRRKKRFRVLKVIVLEQGVWGRGIRAASCCRLANGRSD